MMLISVDTLRSDHLGYAGYPRPVSPNIDALAADSLVFTEAYSQSGWTLPSMATVFTGKYPKDHGAVNFHCTINKELPTLPSVLKEHGYYTVGFVSHLLLYPRYGFDRGFDKYDYSVLEGRNPHEISTSRDLSMSVSQELETIKRPFFLWVHFFDPHFRYLDHLGWTHFGDSDLDRYDQEIAFTDYQLGVIFSSLKKRQLYENTIIVFLADHGEEFGEHGGQYHDTHYQEVLRIPLMVKAPFLKAGKSATIAEQIDIFPTVLAMAGIQPDGDYPGKNLIKSLHTDRPVFVESERPPGFRLRSAIYKGFKLVHIDNVDIFTIPVESRGAYAEPKNVYPGTYLFDLSKDPEEKQNLFSSDNPMGKEMLKILGNHFSGVPYRSEEIPLDDGIKNKLRGLGYLR